MMKFHPFANVFPLMSADELKELAADIEAHGQREPIFTFEGQILDGRNRYRACRLAKRKPWIVPWEGDDPVAFVVSMNLRRRHLNESQRAIVAGKLASLTHGKHPSRRGEVVENTLEDRGKGEWPIGHSPSSGGARVTIPQAAELLNVGRRSVRRAREVLQHGNQSLVDAVEAGEVSVTDAANVVDKPKPMQQAALEAVRAGDAKTLAMAAERLEPREQPEDTSAVGPRTDSQLKEESTVVIRRSELEYHYERIRSLRWRVRSIDPGCGLSYLREEFDVMLTLINELDDFVSRHLELEGEASP